MLEEAKTRTAELQRRLATENVEVAIFTNESSIAYLAWILGAIYLLNSAVQACWSSGPINHLLSLPP